MLLRQLAWLCSSCWLSYPTKKKVILQKEFGIANWKFIPSSVVKFGCFLFCW
ncbi:hypothetical protein CIPAW_05G133700 [Carya illinoinensis]|uniref:Uncharacterized protein n=1 Tax=Carya illinoinensis TaxID=32201 RepID=A0A8T1QJF8_CARIL|nr:hypothetical protein CIPAW_05G133700 [Carya illinoinensis]KAG6654272.1 hypothetical protein CIPAW_05G133700 [Carya illinoinensis]KAG6654273.1 hypothetical protein CIPAW_05G133700 [Carya illinoinensis]KAG6654274.1 hypothetical protein CIPAW_05G133700 [Carya illinoinensis]